MKISRFLPLIVSALGLILPTTVMAEAPQAIAPAVNALGLDLYRAQAKEADGNLLLSPYSIAAALGMTYAGADGDTKTEMQKTLHLPADAEAAAKGFGALSKELADMTAASKKQVARSKEEGGPNTPTEVNVANRLFVQKDYPLRKPFTSLLADRYHAPLEQMDFRTDAEGARKKINAWVEDQTKKKIRDLVPGGALTKDTGVVLVNAIYLHAAWANEFSEKATKPAKFSVNGNKPVDVPTMHQKDTCGYAKREGYTAISLPYAGRDLAFLILLPDAEDGLAKLEKSITADLLEKEAKIQNQEIDLYLPKFRIEPATTKLAEALQGLGMKTAFDIPKHSANFDRMAPRQPDDYLYINEIFHKAYLALDEKGTEAAAATAVVIFRATAEPIDKPPTVRVDHPFMFAIQHVPSGTCLFLGRVTDPR